MRMTHFKNANVDVSQLAVGTWGLDSLRWNGAMSETEAIEAIRAMIQGGVNLIDTAPNYGNHSSEQIVGKAIQGLNRSEILISTKFGTHQIYSPAAYSATPVSVRSWRKWPARCATSRPITSIFISCIGRIRTRRLRKRCVP